MAALANILSYLSPVGMAGKAISKSPRAKQGLKDFFLGKPEQTQSFSTLAPESQQVLGQLTGQIGAPLSAAIQQIMQTLSGSPESLEAFQRPQLRQFQEQILPMLAEGFGGMGATSSSGAQQTFARAGERLQESLSAQKSGLQQNSIAQILQLLGMSMPQSQQNVIRPETFGFLGNIGQGIGAGIGNLPFLGR